MLSLNLLGAGKPANPAISAILILRGALEAASLRTADKFGFSGWESITITLS